MRSEEFTQLRSDGGETEDGAVSCDGNKWRGSSLELSIGDLNEKDVFRFARVVGLCGDGGGDGRGGWKGGG